MHSPDIAATAKGLTKAQREAVLSAEARKFSSYPDRWICRNAGRVADKLKEKGVVFLAVPFIAWRSDRRDVCLTDLGLAVRAHLLESPTHDR